MQSPQRPPLFVLLFFSVFGFIGIVVLVFLWGSGGGFGSPPLPFKLFGSLIALGFMAMGLGMPISVLTKGRKPELPFSDPMDPGSYGCPNCGANVKDAEVSRSGDVKCPYCNSWWNIHRG